MRGRVVVVLRERGEGEDARVEVVGLADAGGGEFEVVDTVEGGGHAGLGGMGVHHGGC